MTWTPDMQVELNPPAADSDVVCESVRSERTLSLKERIEFGAFYLILGIGCANLLPILYWYTVGKVFTVVAFTLIYLFSFWIGFSIKEKR